MVAGRLGALRVRALGITHMQGCMFHGNNGTGGEPTKGLLEFCAQPAPGRDTDSQEDGAEQ